MVKILVTDPLSAEGLDVLREAGFQVEVATGADPDGLKKHLKDADGWILRSGSKATAELIDAAPELKVIGRAGVGVDNIDVAAATARGVVVLNTPYGNSVSVAEHTFALMLALARHVPRGDASLRRGEWQRKELKGVELEGKTLGLIGLGRIGRLVAERARGFGMHIVAHDPYISAEVAKSLGIELLEIEAVWPRADFISLHVPLTPKTEGLVDEQAFAAMRKGVRIVNAARGGIIEEGALLAAVKDGTVAGAALDVFAAEPPIGNALLERPEIVATPHLGASTAEAGRRVALQVAEFVAAYLTRGEATTAVNLAASVDKETAPFIPLAEALGAWAIQLLPGQPRKIHVTLQGTAAKAHARLVADAAVKGIMEVAHGGGRVNLVNARMLAQDAGISVAEASTADSPDFPNLVLVRVESGDGAAQVTGTHLSTLGPRIVSLDGYEVEVKPHGRFLVLYHKDTPGTVSLVSGTLGDHDINIAQMVVGRLAPRGDAISILRVDDPLPDEVLDALRERNRFHRVARVEI